MINDNEYDARLIAVEALHPIIRNLAPIDPNRATTLLLDRMMRLFSDRLEGDEGMRADIADAIDRLNALHGPRLAMILRDAAHDTIADAASDTDNYND